MVFIDANTGKPVNRFSMIHSALDRELLEASINNGGTPDDPDDDSIQLDPVWREGDPLPGDLDEDQLSEVRDDRGRVLVLPQHLRSRLLRRRAARR